MENIDVVKAYFTALDAMDMEQVNQYLDEDYALIDFTAKPMGKDEMLLMKKLFQAALPNLKHSLSNIREENRVVKLTVQLSGTNMAQLDLRTMGLGVVPCSKKFIIFPNGNFEFTVKNGKILVEKDVSPVSPNRRMSGMLKAMGVNIAVVKI